MAAVGVVALLLAAFSAALVKLLSHLDGVHRRMTGRSSTVHRHVPWLRSMRGERPHGHAGANEFSPSEVILIASVVLVVVLFEIWFFFYSPSPIDLRSGRG